MDHFYFNPHSAFCDTREGVAKFVKKLNSDDLEVLKKLDSFRRLGDDLKKAKISDCDDDMLKESIVLSAKEFPRRLKEWVWCMKALYSLTKVCPDVANFPQVNYSFFGKGFNFDGD